MRRTYLAISVVILMGCAKPPEAIKPLPLSNGQFADLSCSEISASQIETETLLSELSAKQRDAQAGDAVGVFVLGIPMASAGGHDKELAIGHAKGRLKGLKDAAEAKGCPSAS